MEVLVEQNINGRTDTTYIYGVDRISKEFFNQTSRTSYYLYDPRGSVAVVIGGIITSIDGAIEAVYGLEMIRQDFGKYQESKARDGELKRVYDSIKEAQNYPEGFEPRQNGTTKNTVHNKELLDKLREIEAGTWKKAE